MHICANIRKLGKIIDWFFWNNVDYFQEKTMWLDNKNIWRMSDIQGPYSVPDDGIDQEKVISFHWIAGLPKDNYALNRLSAVDSVNLLHELALKLFKTNRYYKKTIPWSVNYNSLHPNEEQTRLSIIQTLADDKYPKGNRKWNIGQCAFH